MTKTIGEYFKIGGRYRNRNGWYEVIDISGNEITIKYEHDGQTMTGPEQILRRIWENIKVEEKILTPHNVEFKNKIFFRTLGYLVNHSFIEAIIPLKSKIGFDNNYFRVKKKYPLANQSGYYVHSDPQVDKWGVEMRLTFQSTKIDLDFGEGYSIVNSLDPSKLRINSNKLCYDLLERGFDLGDKQNPNLIAANVPTHYANDFEEGLKI